MEIITWNDQFSVNVKEIDEQHKKLVIYINELYEAMKIGKGNEIIGEIVEKMANYTVEHFATEEKYFDLFNYNLSTSHKLEHKEFVEKVVEFKKGYNESKIGLTIKVMEFLRDWLKAHILESDKKYTDCFNKNGLF